MADTIHKVVSGDTLWDIAERYLGSGSKYPQIAALNNLKNPDLIYVGQELTVIKDTSGGGSTPSTPTKISYAPTNIKFGALASNPKILFATWDYSYRHQTENYKVIWKYKTLDGLEYVGNNSNITVDPDDYEGSEQSTFDIPDTATEITFRVKPISKTYKKDDKDVTYWEGEWSELEKYTNGTPVEKPPTPSLEVKDLTLTAVIDDVGDLYADSIVFKLVKNNTDVVGTSKAVSINTKTGYVSYQWSTSDAGSEYKVCAQAVLKSSVSEWSDYSNTIKTRPDAPSKITTYRANSETSVYLEWSSVKSAVSYDIEYTTKKEYFDGSDQTTTKTGIEGTHFEITGLESGKEYFFRVRAVGEDSTKSGWTSIVSVVVGSKPAAPTTWSSSTTAIVGEALNLYWVHNSEDGSSQTYAELELIINGVSETHTIKNSTDEEEKDKTSVYALDTSTYSEGFQVLWKVRTAGVTKDYGDWSAQRTIDIYAQPSLELTFTDVNGTSIETLTAFPGYVKALPGPKTQSPIGYHLSVVSNSIYETVDSVGNTKVINVGEAVYSKHFDITDPLLVELSAGNIDLESDISYTIICTASMDSGLTAETQLQFQVAWSESAYSPNAEIAIDRDIWAAHIRPYCEEGTIERRQVTQNGDVYTVTDTVLASTYGSQLPQIFTTTGEQVYSGVDGSGNEILYCSVTNFKMVENVTLAVYRREFDGGFTLIASGLDNARNTTVTDPHPSLDLARYRIVATSNETGAVGYTDLPGIPTGCDAAIIQWDEAWSNFETEESAALEQPPWSGSLIKLLYNLDVSENTSPDVEMIDYIGRSQPVSYYGTKIGNKTNWSADVLKSDKDLLYALRRLQRWMGDVYVREPSGLGYRANVTVSFSQTHANKIVPVSLIITRVEGDI